MEKGTYNPPVIESPEEEVLVDSALEEVDVLVASWNVCVVCWGAESSELELEAGFPKFSTLSTWAVGDAASDSEEEVEVAMDEESASVEELEVAVAKSTSDDVDVAVNESSESSSVAVAVDVSSAVVEAKAEDADELGVHSAGRSASVSFA